MKQITWIALSWLALLTMAQAASFDCTKAQSNIEHVICGNPEISRLDDELSVSYKSALQDQKHFDSVKSAQKKWMKERNACSDETCLVNTYKARIAQLSSNNNMKDGQIVRYDDPDAKACQEVVGHMNRGTLNHLKAPISGIDPSGEAYWSVDLNNDGILDHLVILVEGTMRINTALARSGKGGAGDTMGGDVDYDLRLDVLNAGGRYYVFDGSKLWNLTKQGKFQSVCLFRQAGEPVVELIAGKENSVCAVLKSSQEIRYVSYVLEHALGNALPNEERFYSMSPKSGFARVDINNDGVEENVIQLEYISSAGRGCEATYLAVTDETKSTIPETELNKLLLEEIGSSSCGPTLNVFVHDGVSYVDEMQDDNHKIYRIKKNAVETVCESRSRITFEAVSTNEKQ